jgi:hypothetical protein
MKTTIITIISILLAIPTYGLSIIVWLFIKYKIDKHAASRVLINAIVMSYENGGTNEIRYHINNAALPMVFDIFGGRVLGDDIGDSISGILPHPRKNIVLLATLTQVSGNRLLIKATEAPNNF